MCWLQQSSQLWYCPTFLLLPLLLVACVECFAGYHAWRFLLGLNGAILGFVVGAMASAFLGNPVLLILGALAGAAGGAVLFAGFVPLGSAVFAFGTAASLTILVCRFTGIPPVWCMPAALLAGIGGAGAILALRRPAMILLAALAGAQQIVCALDAYRAPADVVPLPDVVSLADAAGFLTLALAGAVLQIATSRPKSPTQPKARSRVSRRELVTHQHQ